MTTILQISDTHIVAPGELVAGRLDTADALDRMVARIGAIRHQFGGLDAVLVSGDLSDDGSAQSYDHFRKLIAPLEVPLHVIPGNHDARAPMRAAFANQIPGAGPINWDRRIGEICLIGLDTLVEGQKHGTLTPATLTFLQDALIRADGAPVLLALHHPPFPCGIRFMDDIGLTNQQDFADAVSGYAGELRIVCGHIHAMMIQTIAGHVAISAPSPNSTFAYDRRPDAPVGFHTQEDGCLLHRWDGGFQSIRIGPDDGDGPIPFQTS